MTDKQPARKISDALGEHSSALLEAYERHAPICITDPDGTITYVNSAFCEMCGYTEAELLGKSHRVLDSDTLEGSFYEDLWQQIGSREVWRGLVCNRSSEGESVWVDATIIPFSLSAEDAPGYVSISTVVTHLVNAHEDLKQSENRLSLSQNYASIGTWEWNLETDELAGTDWIDTLYGYERGKFEKNIDNFMDAVHPDDRDSVERALQQCLQGDSEFNVEHRIVLPDSSARWVSQRGDVQKNTEGKPVRMFCVVQDIHDRKLAEDVANRSNQVKSKFLASVSHELRTPLNAVMGFSQILQADPAVSDRHLELVGNIYNAGNHLLGIINEIIDYSKIEAGVIEISREEVSLPELLDEIGQLLATVIENRNIWLSYSREPRRLWTDRKRLKQVLINFISNAVKYNREGGSVLVSWCDKPGNGETLRLSVTDTGIGIERGNLEQLFTPFDRLGLETSDIDGMGVGLTLSRTLARAMGGDVGVDSELGIGSTFWIDLPQNGHGSAALELINGEGQATDEREARLSMAFSSPPILVMDADSNGRSLIASQLQHLRCNFELVNDRLAALEQITSGRFKLFIMTYNQAGERGNKLADEVRRIDNEIPIVLISDERDIAAAASISQTTGKPLPLEQLQQLLARHVEYSPLEPFTGESGQDLRCFDLEKLQSYVGYSSEPYYRILTVLADALPEAMTNLHEYQLARDAEGILFELHKLKSSAAAIGSEQLLKTAEELALMVRNSHWDITEQALSRLKTITGRILEEINSALSSREKPQISRAAATAASYDLSDFSFLLLDDDSFVLDTIGSQLEVCQAEEVYRFLDAESALEFLQREGKNIDYLLCDIHMPGKDGIWMMRELASLGFQGRLILISGEDLKLLHIAADFATELSLDLAGYLRKPFHLKDMAQMVLHSAGLGSQPEAPALPRLEDFLEVNSPALDPYRVRLEFQPRVDFHHEGVVIAEVLVSLENPEGDHIGPDQFMPMLEQQGKVEELNSIVFRKAAERLSRWLDSGANLKLAVDFSKQSLGSQNLADNLLKICRQFGIAPQDFILEISESSLLDELAPVLETLGHLRVMGFLLSIADFGTGYATFKKLQRLPSSELKLSRSHIAEAADNAESRSILASSVLLARKLGIRTVANGIENETFLEVVRELNCDMGQGDFIIPAMSTELFGIWLESSEN
jgi:PAS domain S-box-containing protein